MSDSEIPKVIHYCWFGGNPLPKLAKLCIGSWRKYFPDYEIKEWNEDNFDVNIIPYTAEAYAQKKYAFVSDYARFWILFHYGGIYFDTDVEVIRPMDDIVNKGNFMGCEHPYDTAVNSAIQLGVAPGLGLGMAPRHKIMKELLDIYAERHFVRNDGTLNLKTIVATTTELLCQHGMMHVPDIQCCADVWIYPSDYFCPKDLKTNKLTITSNSRSIHHFDGSWLSDSEKLKMKVIRVFGDSLTQKVVAVKQLILHLIGKK